MELWWQGLNLELQIFYGIGVVALIALIIQFVLLFVGDFDHVGDFADAGGIADHGSGLGIFSFRGITAFFLGFGWTGAIAVKSGFSVPVAIVLALLVGAVLMVAIFLLMRSMMRLQSSGTLDYENAVGEVATVYVTVPESGKSGGQVEVMIQGRLSVAEALHRGETPLAPGTKVRVVATMGRTTFVVEPLLS